MWYYYFTLLVFAAVPNPAKKIQTRSANLHPILNFRFSVDVYFFILMGIMLMSFVSFILINVLSQFQSEKASGSSVMIRSASSSSSSEDAAQDPDEEFSPRSMSPVLKGQHEHRDEQQKHGGDHIEKRDSYIPIRYDRFYIAKMRNT